MLKNLRETDAKRNTKTSSKAKKEDYDLILKWRNPDKPFITQKLSFKADVGFANAYKEAKKIRKLLVSVGGFVLSDVKIVGVAKSGAFESYLKEHRIIVRNHREDMQNLIKEAKLISKNAVRPNKKTMTTGSFKTTV